MLAGTYGNNSPFLGYDGQQGFSIIFLDIYIFGEKIF